MSDTGKIAQYFSRQIRLAEIGLEGQQKISGTSVLIVGAGGLGNPVSVYLAAAGVKKIGIMDMDVVEMSNLHRQILFSENDLGKPKTEVVKNKLQAQFPFTEVISIPENLHTQNAKNYIGAYDLILDCTDNVEVRYLISDTCRALGKTWFYAAVNGFSCQWAVFDKGLGYRDVFPQEMNAESLLTCEINGTIGVVPGVAALMQATEVIKYILGRASTGMLHTLNLLDTSLYSVGISPSGNAAIPGVGGSVTKNEFPTDLEISVADMMAKSANQRIQIIDVREEEEMPVCRWEPTRHIPLRLLDSPGLELPSETQVVVICQTGKRSLLAAGQLRKRFPGTQIYSLKGGVVAWQNSGTFP